MEAEAAAAEVVMAESDAAVEDEEDVPATQEDPYSFHESEQPATQEEDDDDAAPATDENAAPAPAASSSSMMPPPAPAAAASSSRGVLPSALKHPAAAAAPPPHMAKRAEVAWATKLSRTISIDRLPQESKRMMPASLARVPSEEGIGRKTLSLLLRPKTWAPEHDGSFCLTSDEIIKLCDCAQEVFEAEPTLLQCSAPIKVFGDIHGQYQDLMRLFAQFGSPSREADGGDIQVCDYLFLGDYVDRGKHSLEVVCLLLALKLSFPNRIFLVRGNHESPEVNARDGFLHECVQRLGGRAEGIAAWRRVNLVFEWLPMAALINNAILGVHGGIGRGVESPSQIAAMRRPLRMGSQENGALLLDLLWSDPTASDAVEGVHTNHERGHPVVCYGPDRVKSFLEANNLSLILRAHECVMDGFQRFAGGRLITVFSATNYCNRWANAGAILLVGKDLEIVPKMIYPLDDLEDAWIDAPHPERSPANDTPPPEDLREMRPPTPPRDAPEALREKKAEKEEEDDDDDAKPPPQRMGMGPPQLKRKASLMSSLVREELEEDDDEDEEDGNGEEDKRDSGSSTTSGSGAGIHRPKAQRSESQ